MSKVQTHISTSGRRVLCKANSKTCPRQGHLQETYQEQENRVETDKLLSLNATKRKNLIKNKEMLTEVEQKALADSYSAAPLIFSDKITDPKVYEEAAKNAMENRENLDNTEERALLLRLSKDSTNSKILDEIYNEEKIHHGITSNPSAVLTNLARNPNSSATIVNELAKNSTSQLTTEAAYAHPKLEDKLYLDALAEVNKPATTPEEYHKKNPRVAGLMANERTHPDILFRTANGEFIKHNHVVHVIGQNKHMGSQQNVDAYLNKKNIPADALHYRTLGVSSNQALTPEAVPVLIESAQKQGNISSVYRLVAENAKNGETVSALIESAQTSQEVSTIAQGIIARKSSMDTPLSASAAKKLAEAQPKTLGKTSVYSQSFLESNLDQITPESVEAISKKQGSESPKVWNRLALKATKVEDRIRIASYGKLDDIATTSFALDSSPRVRAAVVKNPSVSLDVLRLITEREPDDKIRNTALREMKKREKFNSLAK